MQPNTTIRTSKVKMLSLVIAFVFIWSLTFSYRVFAEALWTQKDDSMNGEWHVLRSSSSGIDIVGIFESYDDGLYHVEYSPDRGDSWVDITPNDGDIADEQETDPESTDRHIWSDVDISEDGVHLVVSDNNPNNSHNYIWYTPNNAFIWSKKNGEGQPGDGAWNSVSIGANGQDVAAANGSTGNIYVSTDYGGTWADEAPTADNWQSVSFSPSGDFLAAVNVDESKIYVSENQGGVWDDTAAPGGHTWDSLRVSDNGSMIALTSTLDGARIFVAKLIDDAFSWTDTGLGSGFTNRSIDISADGAIVATGEIPGYIAIASMDNPTDWNYQNGPHTGYWEGLDINNNGSQIAVGGYATEVWISDGAPDLVAPVLTEVRAIPDRTTTRNAKYYFSTSEECQLEAEEISSDPASEVTGQFSQDPALPDEEEYFYFTGLRAGGTYSTRIACIDSSDNISNILDIGPFKVISNGGGGGSTPEAVDKFIEQNNATTNNEVPLPEATGETLDITRTLKYKMTGDDVMLLQKYLNTHGFILAASGVGSPGKETNYFGLLTVKAVKAFQSAHGLTPDGIVGPKTRAMLLITI